MRILAYDSGDQVMVGALESDGQISELGEISQFWKNPAKTPPAAGKNGKHLRDVRQRPAVPQTARVICVGLNYRLHAEETKSPIPTIPIIFSRWASTLTVDNEPAPLVDEKFDWEVELGAVIGKRMFRVTAEQAKAGVFGYVTFNDLSARSFQVQTPQWTMGKNSDASGPMSPIVTVDEIGDPEDGLRISTRLNGRTVQDSTTADMIFTVPQIIAHLTQVMTLEPGDLIVTGTPSGVGMATGEFLKTGDVVEVEIEKIGVVRTPIVEAPQPIF